MLPCKGMEMPRVPESVLMMPERSSADEPPQKVVFVRHVHCRFWQFQSALPSPEPRSCAQELAEQ